MVTAQESSIRTPMGYNVSQLPGVLSDFHIKLHGEIGDKEFFELNLHAFRPRYDLFERCRKEISLVLGK